MPLYEYVSATDNDRIELLRPMAEADKPVDDPKGLGRRFVRVQSRFAAQGAAASTGGGSVPLPGGECCPCGKSSGACTRG